MTRADAFGLGLVLAVGIIVYGWVAVHAYWVGDFSDSIDYLFLADFFHDALHGKASDAALALYQKSRFPPLFPLLLGALGADSYHQQLANIVSYATAVLAGVAVWCWVRIEWGTLRATLVALALLLHPGYFLFNLMVISEPLSLIFLAAAFALLATPAPSRARLLSVALLPIGLASLVRTALLPLPIAFAIWLVIARPAKWNTIVLAALLSMAPILGWMVYRKWLGADSYLTSLEPGYMLAKMGGWPNALWEQPWRLVMEVSDNWGMSATPITFAVTLLLIGLAAFGCVLRMRDNRIDAWFLAGYIALILIWPYPDEFGRFLIVAYPLMLVSAMSALRFVEQRWSTPRQSAILQRAPSLALVIAILAATGPTLLRFAHRAMLPVDPGLLSDKRKTGFFTMGTDSDALAIAETHARIRLLAIETGERLPKGACVYSTYARFLKLHGRVEAELFPPGLENRQQASEQLVQCDYFFLSGLALKEFGIPAMYPQAALRGWTEPVLTSVQTIHGRDTLVAALLRRSPTPAPETGRESGKH